MPDFLNIVLSPPDSSLLYIGHYDPLLVTLSVGVAIFASFAALQVSQQVAAATATRRLWIAVGGLSMGAGIWAMHFVGMLALSLPCTTTYDPVITLLSMIPGVLASTLAIAIISRPAITARQLASGGTLLGAGIGTMHYSGMAAYRLDGLVRYDLKLFLLSIAVAVAMAILALWVKFRLQERQRAGSLRALVVAAVVMGLAVSAMHYTGMAAAYFVRDGDAAAITSQMSPSFLASIVLVVTSAIIVITLVATFLARPAAFAFHRGFRLVGALVLGWSVVAWLAADYYTSSLQGDVYAQEAKIARTQASDVAGNIGDALKVQKGIPVALAHHDSIQATLRRFGADAAPSPREAADSRRLWSQDPALAYLSSELKIIADSLDSDVAWIMNAAGDCIASSNAGKETSFVGTNYADRDYFRMARQGQAGWQYAVGRRTRVPGLFFSYPVLEHGRFIGTVAVKRDITNFARWTRQANAFLVDANGVIVLTADRRLEFLAMPDSSVTTLSEADRKLSYLRTSFEPLPLSLWKDGQFPKVMHIAGSIEPAVLAYAPISGYALTVYVPRPLPELLRLEAQKYWMFLLVALAGDLLIVAVAALLLYMYSVRLARDAATDASRALEVLVETRTAELARAKDAAEAANRAKSAFLAHMSHELRTPLNAILGFAQILERDDAVASRRREIETINRSGRHLLGLINNVLDISRIEAGRMAVRHEAFDLPTALAATEEMVRLRAEAKGLDLTVEIHGELPAQVLGDDNRLRQVLINLLGNAVKYTDHGQIRLRVYAGNGSVRFEVTDSGPGIPREEQLHLFEPFYQTATGVTKGEGSGLGLSISHEFVRLMGGELTVRSEPGHGCAFSFSVPLPPTSIAADAVPAERVIGLETGPEPPRILVAEDHADSRELMLRLLEGAGFAVRTAENGQQAVEAFQAWRPHFIWMDMRMPVMDGYAATRAIRALPGGREVRIAALTASAFEEDRSAILAAGCDEMTSKPIEESRLFALMGKLLHLRPRYAEASVASNEAATTDIDISALPDALRQELMVAADALDGLAVRAIVARMDSAHAGLARAITALIEDYRLDKVADLCRRAES